MNRWIPETVEELARDFPATGRVLVSGGATKSGLFPKSTAADNDHAHEREQEDEQDRDARVAEASASADVASAEKVVQLSTERLSGIGEYEPTEFTITALAGTRLATLTQALAEHHQYLPFDPMWLAEGATLGGAIAAGINGPGRFRYGGLRDFILGVQIVDGFGKLRRGGGKVVKNAAGFDLPKLMVGSCGWYGAITEVTLKVFPAPPDRLTVRGHFPSLADALAGLAKASTMPFDIDALEWELLPETDAVNCWLRLAGDAEILPKHAQRVMEALGAEYETLDAETAQEVWQRFSRVAADPITGQWLRIPTTPTQLLELDRQLAKFAETHSLSVSRRYGMGGQLAWVGLPSNLPAEVVARFDEFLPKELAPSWTRVIGRDLPPGRLPAASWPFAERIKDTIDPDRRWASVLEECTWAAGESLSL